MEVNNNLCKIANAILVNTQYNHFNGILKGKLGICIFLYHFARYSKAEQYQVFADFLLEDIISSLNSDNLGFAYGLSGIGYGINYLSDCKFIDTENEDILRDIEEVMYDHLEMQTENDISSEYPLCSIGLYMTSKTLHDNNIIKRLFLQWEEILKSSISIDENNISFFNSIIHIIICIHKKENYDKKIDLILALLLSKIDALKSCNTTLSHLINQIPFLEKNKYNYKKAIASTQNAFIWEHLLYFKNEYVEISNQDIDSIIANTLKNNLSIDGLAGIGLNLMKQECIKANTNSRRLV